MRTLTSAAIAAILFGASASANDFYVDAVHGSDLGTGVSGDAWQTITHALASVGAAPVGETHTIHIASGVHDLLLGEVFPLEVPTGTKLVGMGPQFTFIDGAGSSENLVKMLPGNFDPALMALIEGLTLLHGSQSGIDMRSDTGDIGARLRNLHITLMNGAGVSGVAPSGAIDAYLERLDVDYCGTGLYVVAAFGGPANFELTDCSLTDNGTGMFVYGQSAGVELQLRRCKILRSSGSGIGAGASLFGGGSVRLYDSLVAANGQDAISAGGDFDGSGFNFYLERCTLVDNARFGLDSWLNCPVWMEGCILWGHQDDITSNTLAEATLIACDVEDGDFAGIDDNFSADPGFRDAAAGDYRLSFGSPCSDADTTTTSAGSDLAGLPRPVDGDLDTLRAGDVGAFELQTLTVERAPRLGQTMALGCWGVAGSATEVWVSRTPAPGTVPTVFGPFELVSARRWGYSTANSGPPGYFVWFVPNDPVFLGLTVFAQALTDSAAAPSARAWSNKIEMTIGP